MRPSSIKLFASVSRIGGVSLSSGIRVDDRASAVGRRRVSKVRQLRSRSRGSSVGPSIFAICQHAAFAILFDGLNLQVLKDMHPAPGTQIGRRTRQRVLAQVQGHDRGHEPQFDGQSRDAVGAQVQEY